MSDEPRMALYETKVHARNLNADYGIRVDVYAVDRQDAVNRAVAIGWLGYPDDARVTVLRVVDTHPASTSTGTGTARDTQAAGGEVVAVSNQRPVRNIHYEGRNLRERLTALVESWQSTGPKQQSTRDLLTDLIGVLGEYDPEES